MILVICILPLTLIRFTVVKTDEALSRFTGGLLGETLPMTEFPVGKEYFTVLAAHGDEGFDCLLTDLAGFLMALPI